MKRQVFDCDSCGTENLETPILLSLPTGRVCSQEEWGGSGRPRATFTEVEICSNCASRELTQLVRDLDASNYAASDQFKETKAWIERLKEK